MEPLASMRGVSKFIYGGDGRRLRNTEVKILDGVDFDVFPGEVHVLVGENGAGKSTLMKILGGVIPPDSGELRISGETATFANARDARRNGVAFIHQELNLCANLDVAHNIFLGREPRRRGLIHYVTVVNPEMIDLWLRDHNAKMWLPSVAARTTQKSPETSHESPEPAAAAEKQPPIGIDLGTTYSLVAYLYGTGRPTTVLNGTGDLLTPTPGFSTTTVSWSAKRRPELCIRARPVRRVFQAGHGHARRAARSAALRRPRGP